MSLLVIVATGCALAYLPLAPGPLSIVAKAGAVGALAVAASLAARNLDGWLLAALLAAGTAGDVLLDLPDRFSVGVGAFALGHVTAIALYLRHRRRPRRAADTLGAAALLGLGIGLPALLVAGDYGLAVYALLLSGMVAAALTSRLPRSVALGALLFLLSDCLIGVRMLPATTTAKPVLGLAIWWLYFIGQLLIFTGASRYITASRFIRSEPAPRA